MERRDGKILRKLPNTCFYFKKNNVGQLLQAVGVCVYNWLRRTAAVLGVIQQSVQMNIALLLLLLYLMLGCFTAHM